MRYSQLERRDLFRCGAILACVVIVMTGHWLTPTEPHTFHSMHVIFRKLFVIPVVIAATWYGLTGALLTVSLISFFYLPHVLIQWGGNTQENINQLGELATAWMTAFLAGILMNREKVALLRVARTHEGALTALVTALDSREHHTAGHCLRVRAYTRCLARALRFPEKKMAALGDGALLHDIGKIGVPDRILLKEGHLTPEEWEIMKKHPEDGRRILDPIALLSAASDVVYGHHERFDGTGYPRGLSNGAIPLEARIFAVADAFDALVSDRPYRKGVGMGEAKTEIRRGAGSQFDPVVVAALDAIPEQELAALAAADDYNSTGSAPRYPERGHA